MSSHDFDSDGHAPPANGHLPTSGSTQSLDREGGGDRHHLHALGQLLKDNRAPFETRTLPTGFGDYVIARRRARIHVARGRGNDVAPVLIERKYAAVHKSIFAADAPTHWLIRAQVGRRRRGVAEGWTVAAAARRHASRGWFFEGGDRLYY